MSISGIAFCIFVGICISAYIIASVTFKYEEDVDEMIKWREEIFRED